MKFARIDDLQPPPPLVNIKHLQLQEKLAGQLQPSDQSKPFSQDRNSCLKLPVFPFQPARAPPLSMAINRQRRQSRIPNRMPSRPSKKDALKRGRFRFQDSRLQPGRQPGRSSLRTKGLLAEFAEESPWILR
jgi:hypothetical protein